MSSPQRTAKSAISPGRVQLLSPGLACLTCGGLLDGNEVRRDMMSEGERKQDPYLVGAREPAPSVISLNAPLCHSQ